MAEKNWKRPLTLVITALCKDLPDIIMVGKLDKKNEPFRKWCSSFLKRISRLCISYIVTSQAFVTSTRLFNIIKNSNELFDGTYFIIMLFQPKIREYYIKLNAWVTAVEADS